VTGNRANNSTTGVIVSAVWVIGFAVVVKALGLFKDVIVASKFGTTATMDAFLVAFTLPTLVTQWLRTPVRAGFVPLFTEELEKKGEDEAWRSAGTFIANFMIVAIVLAAVAMVAAPWLVSAVAPGFDLEYQTLATSLTRIMMLSLFIGAGAGILTHVLHVHGNFALPAAAQPLGNLMIILAALTLTATHGIKGLAYGVVMGSVAHAAVMWPAVWRLRRNLRLRVDFSNPMFRGVMRLALPLIIGMAGAKLDDVIDRIFASRLAAGSISGLAYALRLIELPKEILVGAFSIVLFPLFSRLAAREQYDELGDKLITSMRLAFFVLLPVSVAMAMLGEPFVRLIFERGAFGEESVSFTVSALLLYTPTIWALGLTSIMAAGFIAMKNTKTPVIVGFVRLGFKIALVFALIGAYKHSGIALATSVSHVFKLGVFLLVLPPVIRRGRYRTLFRAFGGTALATAVMAAALFLFARGLLWIDVPDSLAARGGMLGAAAVVGVLVYATAARFFARNELREAVRAAKDGFREVVGKRLARSG
jgi:putative peptidoglycan lipid II flippase